MPVRRFRSVDDAEQSVWMDRNDPRLWSAIKSVWEFSDRVYPYRFPPGVHKHQTIDDANRQTAEWETLNLRKTP